MVGPSGIILMEFHMGSIAWEHRDLSNASVNISGLAEGSNAAELEPMGMNAGAFHLIAPALPAYRLLLKGDCDYPGFADSTRVIKFDFINFSKFSLHA
jgi:hypothetical protein